MDSYSETLERIYQLRESVIDLRLDRMEKALARFDHPEKKIPSIHIAGTNGKGSTAAMVQRILSVAGYRAALYTSPHLVSFTERMRIGEREISEAEVVALAEEVHRYCDDMEPPLTFFEFVTVMALVYFARQEVDIAVIEVGLGGRLDATNVITPLVSAITTIALDHQAYLGSDELSIAREKGGIIKPGVPVVCGTVSGAVAALLKSIAIERAAPAYFLGVDYGFSLKNDGLFDYTGIKQYYSNIELTLRGRHQRANASLALAILELLEGRFHVTEENLRIGLATVHWPGRLEVMLERPTVLLDGAHNCQGVNALVDELTSLRQGRKIKLLFATMADKEWELMLDVLAQAVDEVIFTRVDVERSADPRQLADKLKIDIPHRVVDDSRRGLQMLLDESQTDDLVVVAGSLYLLGEVRPMLQRLAAQAAAPRGGH
ncbi:MAG: bifunctional folylpolyglutamate synthase/dihydrofolate synthase [Deltaproteobacteria bacterium]|nr:bifunctional folylpolyglutamate synthase/dihydrofolate synthase [Deltaproteobacteria bacterium]